MQRVQIKEPQRGMAQSSSYLMTLSPIKTMCDGEPHHGFMSLDPRFLNVHRKQNTSMSSWDVAPSQE